MVKTAYGLNLIPIVVCGLVACKGTDSKPEPAAETSAGKAVPTKPAPTPHPAPSNATVRPLTADDITKALEGNGLGASKVIVYDENTDPNKLLGRPGQYTVKVNWTVAGDEASIEVFPDMGAAKDRAAYVDRIGKAAPMLLQYVYTNAQRLAVLRLPRALAPSKANEWKIWFDKL